MLKYLYKVLPIILVMLVALFLSGCVEKKEPVKDKPVKESTTKYLLVKVGDEVLAPFFDEHEFSGRWAPAKIVTPASDETKGKYEVEFLMGTPDLGKGEKRFVKDIIVKTHPAKKNELKVGLFVITTGDNPEDLAGTEMCVWNKAVISDIKDDGVEVEFFHSYPDDPAYKEVRFPHNIFIIDVPK